MTKEKSSPDTSNRPSDEKLPNKKPILEVTTEEESKHVLAKTEIVGDEFRNQALTVDILDQNHLRPSYKMEVEGHGFWFSLPYQLGEERIAVVAYVQKGKKIVARSYYRSHSQGIWRFLPRYSFNSKDKEIDWYDKGFGEESITLPVSIQQGLAKLNQPDKSLLILSDPDLILAGTARQIDPQRHQGTYYIEIHQEADKLRGDFYSGNPLTSPEKMAFSDPEDEPDFAQPLATWEQQSSLYGPIQVETFPSRNGRYKFMFCRDQYDRVWIGGIDNNSPIKSTGVREGWIKGGDLTTPAFEYYRQTGNYGNFELKKGKYVDMFQNYLSQVPVIRNFLKHKNLVVPNLIPAQEKTTAKPTPTPEQASDLGPISEAKNWRHLNDILNTMEGIQGKTFGFYPREKLKKLIIEVRELGAVLDAIPRAEGLRNKVEQLMLSEGITPLREKNGKTP